MVTAHANRLKRAKLVSRSLEITEVLVILHPSPAGVTNRNVLWRQTKQEPPSLSDENFLKVVEEFEWELRRSHWAETRGENNLPSNRTESEDLLPVGSTRMCIDTNAWKTVTDG